MILFNPTSSYLWLNKNFLSGQGTEINKNSISYTSFVSPEEKENKNKKERKEKKERVWSQTTRLHKQVDKEANNTSQTETNTHKFHSKIGSDHRQMAQEHINVIFIEPK